MQGKKISFTIHNFKFKYVRQKNLHEGNILYFSLKVCKQTGTKKVRLCYGYVKCYLSQGCSGICTGTPAVLLFSVSSTNKIKSNVLILIVSSSLGNQWCFTRGRKVRPE